MSKKMSKGSRKADYQNIFIYICLLTQRAIYFFTTKNYLYSKLLVWLLLICLPLFLHLGSEYMVRWDESRYAVSSYEMLHHSCNPIVVTYLDLPSNDSPKPPLLHWFQALSIGVFGFNEFAVRFPSALAGLFLCLVMMYFSYTQFNSFSLGAIATLILLSTPEGFCGVDHCARTADYESFLTLFSFLGLIYFYKYTEEINNSKKIFISAVFFTLAVLTKAVAGLFFIPGLIIYIIVKRNVAQVIKNRWFYSSLVFFVTIVGFFFLLRESLTPGYLQGLNDMELIGRHQTPKDGHEGDIWFYYTFLKEHFGAFLIILPISWVIGLSCKDEKFRNFSFYSFVLAFSFYFVLASAQSKLNWYCIPLFPLLAMQISLFFWFVLKQLMKSSRFKLHGKRLFYFAIVALLFVPYTQVVSDVYHKDRPDWYKVYNNVQEYFMMERDIIKGGIVVASSKETQGPYLFYFYKLNEKGFALKYSLGYENYKPGDKLIIEDEIDQKHINRFYRTTILDEFRHLKVLRVESRKDADVPNMNLLSPVSKRLVNIQLFNKNYLNCIDTSKGTVIANENQKGSSAEFNFFTYENDFCVISTKGNKYLSAQIDGNGVIVGDRNVIASWETFTYVALENNYMAFIAQNGKYLSFDPQSFCVYAKADTIGKNEKFFLVDH